MARTPVATVLVVDDNPPTRYSTSRVLRSAGFGVLEAATGGEALVKIGQSPDLIILDVNLPDIDGFTVCRSLRARPETARTPVIHLSATFVKDVDKVTGFEAGADGYLTHPVEPPVLIATVNAFLRTRQAEDAMRTSEAKFKAVFENALNGIALLSDGMIYLDVNPAISRTLGRPREEIIGKHVSAFLPHDSEEILDAVNTALRGIGTWRGTFPVLHALGHAVDLEWSISIHSTPATRLAITTDITERRAIEAERERLLSSERAARAEAERANRLKDEFLAALSHELRTPLNAITGWAQLLRRQHADGQADFEKALEAIERNARVQTQLIADLLDVSRITSGKLRLDPQPLEPRVALESALSAFTAAAHAKGVRMEVRIDEDLGHLRWDHARFQQVVWNLVDNALKFSHRGGVIEINLTGTAAAIDLVIRDNGRGIAPDFLPHVFERFRQEDASTKRRHGGLGLGLAIVKQVVEAHGGTITAHSDGEDRGSTFTVHLPRLEEQTSASVSSGAGVHILTGVRVLLVEDDPDARNLISRILREAEAEVREAADVSAAIQLLDRFHPDVVISDIGMPNQDGYDLVRHLRRSSDHIGTPALALTAFARDEDRAQALGAGFQQHLGKPVDTIRLLEVVATLAGIGNRSA